jgi:hypothetical protein
MLPSSPPTNNHETIAVLPDTSTAHQTSPGNTAAVCVEKKRKGALRAGIAQAFS